MSHNTLIHRVARPLVRPLVATAVTPNQITTLRLLTGLAAAALLAVGQTPWQSAAAGVFLLSMILDRADGELARLSGKSSPFGHTYDLIADSLCNALLFLGLGIGLCNGSFGVWAILLGAAAGVSVTTILWLMMRAEAVAGQRAAHLAMTSRIDPDDALLAVPIALWIGWSEPLLVAAAVGATAFAAFFFWHFRHYLRQGAADGQPRLQPVSDAADGKAPVPSLPGPT